MEKTYYSNGIIEGIYEKHSKNGSLVVSGSYLNGKMNGMWRFNNSWNNLKPSGVYQNGKRVGLWEWYNGNGERVRTKMYN